MRAMSANDRVAAFFDLDGTLVVPPSLEWRFFRELRQRKAICGRNYLSWLTQAARMVRQGYAVMRHANKMYLRGVCIEEALKFSASEQAKASVLLYREGIDQVAWHIAQGHFIVLVSGTLMPLAKNVAMRLAMRLALRGLAGSIDICATELEERGGDWTGHIVSEVMFGEVKARTMRRCAEERGIALAQSYAYADSASDCRMLEAVGHPVTVNASWPLARIARRRGWTALHWGAEEIHHRVRREAVSKLGRTWDERDTRAGIFGE